MSLNLTFAITGDDTFIRRLEQQPKVAQKAARLAINDTLRRGRRMAKKEILSQVNLPPGYVDNTRLTENLAKGDTLRGSIIARRRATSLTRFGVTQLYQRNATKPGRKKAGVTVRVKRARKTIPNAFLLNLKNGNRGLAIRVPEGKKPRRRFGGKPLYKSNNTNVWLLYGPSLNQIMTASNKGPSIVESLQGELSTYLNREFVRQYARLSNGR